MVGAVAVAGLVMAACSSSTTPTATTTKAPPTTAAATLSSLENWPTQAVSLQETGSSLLYPLFNLWVAQAKTQWPSVTVTTGSTGSGTGVADAASGTVNIGASDAYLSTSQVAANPGLENIPLAISGQMIAYNVPGVTGHIKLSGPVIAAIYQGTITNWNDAKIAALNTGVSLPSLPIVTVHRSDSSGDTFLFSSFLTASDPSGWTLAPGTTVEWPTVTGAQGAMGNGGMVTTCKANPGCIAYIGVSYESETLSDGLNYAALKNMAGNYELPTQDTFSAEASGYATSTPANGAVLDDLRVQLQWVPDRQLRVRHRAHQAAKRARRPRRQGASRLGHRPLGRKRPVVPRPGRVRGPAAPGSEHLHGAVVQGFVLATRPLAACSAAHETTREMTSTLASRAAAGGDRSAASRRARPTPATWSARGDFCAPHRLAGHCGHAHLEGDSRHPVQRLRVLRP